MIYEYALDPELVATWAVDRSAGRYFIEKFGLGQPRIVSRYPKRWQALVWNAFKSDNDVERARLTELLQRLGEAMVKRRDGIWDPDQSWLTNAQNEHRRIPFCALLARANPEAHPQVLIADELDDGTAGWAAPRGRATSRSAPSLAAAVGAMLRVAEVIILVDPHFGPHRPRYVRSLQAFLQASLERRPGAPPSRVEVLCSEDVKSNGTAEYFAGECRQRLPRCIPAGLRLRVCRLRQRPAGERLHNRYILTDLGGVVFGVGLDEGDAGDTDDINLLDRSQYEERWRQYANDPSAFDRPEPSIEF
jgi:hypothetical protein